MDSQQRGRAREIFVGLRVLNKVPTRNDVSMICDLSEVYLSRFRNRDKIGRWGIYRSFFYLRRRERLPLIRAVEICAFIRDKYTPWGLTPDQLRRQTQIWITAWQFKTAEQYTEIARLKESNDPDVSARAKCNEAEAFRMLSIGRYRNRIEECYQYALNLAKSASPETNRRVSLSFSAFRELCHLSSDRINRGEEKLRA